MRTTLRLSALSAALVLFLLACKKQPAADTKTTSTHAKLSVFFVHDTTIKITPGAINYDTVKLLRFSYDAQGRTSSIYYRDNNRSNPGSFPPNYNNTRYDFSYKGTDTRPYYYKSVSSLGSYEEAYLYYDAEGYVSKDSTIGGYPGSGPFSYITREYSLQGSKLYYNYKSYQTSNPTGPASPLLRTYDVQVVNNNMTRQQEDMPTERVLHEASFDNKPNSLFEAWPFHHRMPFYTTTLGYIIVSVENDFLVQKTMNKNNQLSQTSTFTVLPSGPVSVAAKTYSYTYDADGYPLLIRQSTPGIPVGIDDNRRYEYKFIY